MSEYQARHGAARVRSAADIDRMRRRQHRDAIPDDAAGRGGPTLLLFVVVVALALFIGHAGGRDGGAALLKILAVLG